MTTCLLILACITGGYTIMKKDILCLGLTILLLCAASISTVISAEEQTKTTKQSKKIDWDARELKGPPNTKFIKGNLQKVHTDSSGHGMSYVVFEFSQARSIRLRVEDGQEYPSPSTTHNPRMNDFVYLFYDEDGKLVEFKYWQESEIYRNLMKGWKLHLDKKELDVAVREYVEKRGKTLGTPRDGGVIWRWTKDLECYVPLKRKGGGANE